MLKPIKVPRGIANLFALGNSSEIPIIEVWANRPDKILDVVGQKSMKNELINNYMSNKSPISLHVRDRYLITDDIFTGNFTNF